MLVRARDDVHRMKDLKGKKIGLSKSLNTIKNDWWRCQEEQGIELMLMLNDMTRDDVEIVEFPYPDDWYDKPEMLTPIYNPSELWLKRDHKHDLAFRPLETALLTGVVDAIYTQTGPFQHIQEATGQIKAIENLANYPDWTLQGANIPATFTVSDVVCEEHPEIVIALMKGLIKVGRWANEHKHAAAEILDKQTYYLDVEDTYYSILRVDMVPNLSPQNLAATEINKDFMLSHGYIKNDFDVHEWAAPEFFEKAAAELLEEEWKKRSIASFPSRRRSRGDGAAARLAGRQLGHHAPPPHGGAVDTIRMETDMTSAEFFSAIAALSGLTFVVAGMLGTGLSLTVAQVLGPLKNRRLVIVALVANFVLVPLLAYVITLVLPLDEPLEIGLIVLACVAGGAVPGQGGAGLEG